MLPIKLSSDGKNFTSMASTDHKDVLNLKNMLKLYMPTWSFLLSLSHFYFLLPLTVIVYIRRHYYTSHCIQSSIILNHFITTGYALTNLRLYLRKPFTTIDLWNTINTTVKLCLLWSNKANTLRVINVHNSTLLFGSSVDTLQVITSCLQVMYRLPLAGYCI